LREGISAPRFGVVDTYFLDLRETKTILAGRFRLVPVAEMPAVHQPSIAPARRGIAVRQRFENASDPQRYSRL
jgi:hypothetical protein